MVLENALLYDVEAAEAASSWFPFQSIKLSKRTDGVTQGLRDKRQEIVLRVQYLRIYITNGSIDSASDFPDFESFTFSHEKSSF